MIRTDIGRLCIQAGDLCREIARRDLGETPLYIVPQSRLPKRLGRSAACNGYTDAPALGVANMVGDGQCLVCEREVEQLLDVVGQIEFRLVLREDHAVAAELAGMPFVTQRCHMKNGHNNNH
jgi:hypothetical protein